MSVRLSVLCPIDFSDSSRGALRYAAALAAHFGARLTLLAVNDPLLEEADEVAGTARLAEDTARELDRLFHGTFSRGLHGVSDVKIEVTAGKPASEILRVCQATGSDIIVMSSHGLTGFRKLFFGSTTERVLRETGVPVLVTPASDPGPERLEDVSRLVKRVVVPVDFSPATGHQLRIARGLAEALDVPVLLLHVVEPLRASPVAQARLTQVEAERRYRAEEELERVLQEIPGRTKTEALIAYGEPAEEIAKVATDRDAGIVVMGLHSSPLLGPRMGSVTYRVLCLAHRLVLALPPQPAAAPHAAPSQDRAATS